MLPLRYHPISIIPHSRVVVFEGEKDKMCAAVIRKMVGSVQSTSLREEISGGENEGVRGLYSFQTWLTGLTVQRNRRNSQDENNLPHIRTKHHEIMISPGTHPLAFTEPYKPYVSPCSVVEFCLQETSPLTFLVLANVCHHFPGESRNLWLETLTLITQDHDLNENIHRP